MNMVIFEYRVTDIFFLGLGRAHSLTVLLFFAFLVHIVSLRLNILRLGLGENRSAVEEQLARPKIVQVARQVARRCRARVQHLFLLLGTSKAHHRDPVLLLSCTVWGSK